MKKRIARLAAFLLVVPMLFTILPNAYAKTFLDLISRPDWMDQEMFDAIMYVTDNGYMGSTSVLLPYFSPTMELTRAQVVQILYSMAGYPSVNDPDSLPFNDVPSDMWCFDAVCWAYERGITAGTSATKFSPNKKVTRQDSIIFLYRFGCLKRNFQFDDELYNSFFDSEEISPYAQEAMSWAVQYCILQPSQTRFVHPQDPVPRWNEAVMICRYDKNAVGFFINQQHYGGKNEIAKQDMNAVVLNRLFKIIDENYPALKAKQIKEGISNDLEKADGKCAGITFAVFFDAIGRHDFNKALHKDNMESLGNYKNDDVLRSAINFYHFGGNRVVHRSTTLVSTRNGVERFREEVESNGPTVLFYNWERNEDVVGHAVIVTKVQPMGSDSYRFTTVDPNYTYERTSILSFFPDGGIRYNDHQECNGRLYSFEYFSREAIEDIWYLDIDGTFNNLSVS